MTLVVVAGVYAAWVGLRWWQRRRYRMTIAPISESWRRRHGWVETHGTYDGARRDWSRLEED